MQICGSAIQPVQKIFINLLYSANIFNRSENELQELKFDERLFLYDEWLFCIY